MPTASPTVVRLLNDPIFVNEMAYLGLGKQLLINVILDMRGLADELLVMIDDELES